MDRTPRPCQSGWLSDPAGQPHHGTADTTRGSAGTCHHLRVVHSGRSHTLDSCRPAVSFRRVDTSWVVRKIRQLDSDVLSLYELLAGIGTTQARHGERLDALDGKVSRLDDRVTKLDHKVDRMEAKLDRIIELLSL